MNIIIMKNISKKPSDTMPEKQSSEPTEKTGMLEDRRVTTENGCCKTVKATICVIILIAAIGLIISFAKKS
jgi:hypothetical protein